MRTEVTASISRIVNPQRRTFLKTGVAGAALLFAGRWLAPAHAKEGATMTSPYKFLTPDDAAALGRIAPVVLRGALPAEPAAVKEALGEILYGIDVSITQQPPSVRNEIRDLFNLLNNGATRAVVAGIWKSWDKTTDADVEAFLSRWQHSRFNLLRTAFLGLSNLITGSWYANPRAWPRIGYGGAPKLV